MKNVQYSENNFQIPSLGAHLIFKNSKKVPRYFSYMSHQPMFFRNCTQIQTSYFGRKRTVPIMPTYADGTEIWICHLYQRKADETTKKARKYVLAIQDQGYSLHYVGVLVTGSSPRFPLRPHSMIHSKKFLLYRNMTNS